MNRVSTVAATLIFGAFASTAAAIPLQDYVGFSAAGTTDPLDLDGSGGDIIHKLERTGDFVAWTHHFTFPSPVSKINSGSLAVTLKDDSSSDGIELAFGFADSGQWSIGLVSNATYTYNLAVKSLYDGAFSVKLVSLLGDFYITKSVLNIDYDSTSVPEPATLSLLGLGLLGAAFGCRRRNKKAMAQ